MIAKSWLDPSDFQEIGLEEAILWQSANVQFADGIGIRRRKDQISFDEFLNRLVHLTTLRLKSVKQGRERLYDKFVDEHFVQNRNNRIISFNYDDVLDKALFSQRGCSIKNLYFPEILPDEQTGSVGSKNKQRQLPHPVMLKFHGSVNWSCSSEKLRAIIKKMRSVMILALYGIGKKVVRIMTHPVLLALSRR